MKFAAWDLGFRVEEKEMNKKTRKIPYPARLDLARTPTPLEPLSRLSDRLGVEMYVKRDDLRALNLRAIK